MSLIVEYLKHPKEIILYVLRHYCRWMSDKQFIRYYYRVKLGYWPNLEEPRTLNEKLNWLKLYDRNPLYHKLVDKYEVKSYVSERLGDDAVIPCYGVWDNFDDIDFDSLPDKFILKCTHVSGGLAICRDKATFDKAAAKNNIERALRNEYFMGHREWAYKDVKPRIIAEELVESLGKPDSIEYKLTCYNGRVAFFTICTGIAHVEFEKRMNDHFDREYNKLDWYAYYKPAPKTPQIPDEMEKMIAYAELLAKDIPQVRVDFYNVDGKILFGEMTFYTWAGFIEFTPPEWDATLGSWLQLPTEKRLG